MAYTHYVGVDPGLDGGIVVLDKAGRVTGMMVMPRTEDGRIDTLALRSSVPLTTADTLLAVEKTWAFPGQGVVSVFTFGRVSGHIIGALEMLLGVKAWEISPQVWQKPTIGRVDDPKAACRAYVADHFPDVDLKYSKKTGQPSNRVKNPHQGLVDALVIADYARRQTEDYL